MNKRVVVLGLDGLTFDCVDPLVQQGLMPNLDRMIRSGSSAMLRSTIPHATAPAWVSFATGCHPGKHGCFDFLVPEKSLSSFRPITSMDIRTQTLYEILEEHDKRVVLINLPVSYPPRLRGSGHAIITSLMTQRDQAVFPAELIRRFPVLKEYRIHPDPHVAANGTDEEYIRDIQELERIRFQCGKELFKSLPWDFFFYLISGTDWIQHRRHRSLRKPNKGSLEAQVFLEFDDYLGWFRNHMPKDAYLFVVSDHGFTLRQGMFYLNTWLWKNGYLQVEREKHESHRISTPHGAAKYRALQKRRFTPLPAMIYWMHISPRFWRALRSLLRPLQRALKLQSDYRYGSAVPQKSKAYCPWEGMWGIFLNDRRRFADGTIQTKEEYQHLLEEIQANLSELKDPESHVQVFDAVEKREDLYQGKWVHQAPDLILTSHRFQIDTIVTHPRILFRPARHQGHSPLGIFVASGPEIQNDLRFQGASIVDVAPTILHLMNTSIPSDRDGRVLWEIFQEDSEVRRRKPTFVTPRPSLETPPVCTAEEKQGVKDRLKSLGYL